MNPDYQNIVVKIREAAQVASVTPQHPEAKLRELVEPLWEEHVRSHRINLHFQPRNERSLANGVPVWIKWGDLSTSVRNN